MKIRHGFVSNSSSSSFVVAFPKEPKSLADVYEMMFYSKEGMIHPYDFIDGMSHIQVAERVWQDLQQKGNRPEWADYMVPAKFKDIVNTFQNRYYYHPKSNVYWLGRENDELGGSWGDKVGPYYGSDSETLQKLRDFTIKTEKGKEEIRRRQAEIMNREFKISRPPYACKLGNDSKTGKPYTKEQIKAHEAFYHALDEFRKNHKEYSELENKSRTSWDQIYKIENVLRKKLATSDARAFRQDNKGSYIVILSYADDGGESTLEHGNIFKNIPHVRISNH